MSINVVIKKPTELAILKENAHVGQPKEDHIIPNFGRLRRNEYIIEDILLCFS